MRKPAKPFKTEYKSRKPPKNAALFDEGMVHGDDLPSRDINADLPREPDDRHDARYEEAVRAANDVFGGPKANLAMEASEAVPEVDERTVLSDLSYKDPLEARLEAAASIKRGRKPGAKNRPKFAPPADAPAPVPSPAPAQPATTATSVVVARPGGRQRRLGFLKQLEARRTMKPGDRWKLKLSKR